MKRRVMLDVNGEGERLFVADSIAKIATSVSNPSEWYWFMEIDADPMTLPEVTSKEVEHELVQ